MMHSCVPMWQPGMFTYKNLINVLANGVRIASQEAWVVDPTTVDKHIAHEQGRLDVVVVVVTTGGIEGVGVRGIIEGDACVTCSCGGTNSSNINSTTCCSCKLNRIWCIITVCVPRIGQGD